MADVVVNITADASGLQNELNNVANGTNNRQTLPPRGGAQPTGTPSGGGGTVGGGQPSAAPQPTNTDLPSMPTYDRMAQDIRREIQNRGVVMVPGSSNFNQFMNMMTQQQRAQNEQAISRNFDVRYSQLDAQRYAEGAKIEADVNAKRQAALQNATNQDDIDRINANFDNVLRTRLERLDRRFAPQYDQLQAEEQNARQKAEEELTKVIQDLTKQIRQGNPDSYLNRLREERRQALWRRDNAATEGEVQDASRDIAAIDRRIARVTGQRNPMQRIGGAWGTIAAVGNIGMNALNAYRANTMAEIGMVNSAANGDAFGAMMQDFQRRRQNAAAWGSGIGGAIGAIGGGILAGAGSMGIGTGAGIAGGAALGGGIGGWIGSSIFSLMYGEQEAQIALGQLWAQQEQRLQRYTQLAMMVRRGRTDIDNIRGELLNTIPSMQINSRTGLSIYDLGYTSDQAAQMMARNIQARGFLGANPGAWALDVDALEKAYNMAPGSLAQMTSYDRYGNNMTQSFANLVASLGRRGTLGMSGGQVLRANEFVGYQQQIMEMQKGWMNPNAEFANRYILAAQNAFGNNLDNRAITEIGQLNNAITNPQEGYSKVLTYDVIQELFPQTRGNLLAIRQMQYSNDPNVRARIQQAMIQRLTQVYGGVNTTSGYLALSQYTGIQDPDRLRGWVNQLQRGLPTATQADLASQTAAVKEYTPELSKEMLSYQDSTVKEISAQLGSLNGIASQMLTTFQNKLNEIIRELNKVNS